MTDPFCMVLTTVNCDSTKNTIIESLLKNKLAACIQVLPIHSHYIWDGKVQEDNEQLLIIKTQKGLFNELESVIQSLHDYDVPQIVQVPITNGLNPYLCWIEESTKTPNV
ncbi:divalent-cation tolerance protein CutA [Vibrio sp. HN007]|uniref:divalent-cation tolerance protein CutA n=1 Tax=Vibrio iocasae TaxID=3098914 RepID=UPI0035D47612